MRSAADAAKIFDLSPAGPRRQREDCMKGHFRRGLARLRKVRGECGRAASGSFTRGVSGIRRYMVTLGWS
jgi:hypothetical protein